MTKVGVFDSGIGGLTVLKDCVRLMPQVQFYYFGDNRHAPYGSKTEAEIVILVRKALERFRTAGVNAAVLACNTATSVCAEQMRREFSFPIVGMEPAASLAARSCKRVLILCTPRTASGSRLASLISRFPNTRFSVFPVPDLADSIERALTQEIPLDLSLHLPRLLQNGSDPGYDGVVLGCTHYIFFRREIADFYHLPVFDGNKGTANRLKCLLEEGISVHHFSPPYDKKFRAIPPVFLGDCAEINEKTYNSNKCFQNFL